MLVSTPQTSMVRECPDIFDLITQYPIFSSILENLHFWDLIQLSRTGTSIRSACHGFIVEPSHEGLDCISNPGIRAALKIGQHNTSTWKLYKSLTSKHCSELDHTKGDQGLGCRLCSRPVCFACIVKHSFGKEENTFFLRGRSLCELCFNSGNPHSEHILVRGSTIVQVEYSRSRLCHCTSQNGILCSDCKRKQNKDSSLKYKHSCAGNGCHNPVDTNFSALRICLWCDSLLPIALHKQQDSTSPLFKQGYGSGIYTQGYRPTSTTHGRPEQDTIPSTLGESVTTNLVADLVGAQTSTSNLAPNHDWPPPEDVPPAYSLHPVEAEHSLDPALPPV